MGKTPDDRAIENQTNAEYKRLEWLLNDEIYCIAEIKRYKAMQTQYKKWPKIVKEIGDEVKKAEKGREKTRKDIDDQIKLMKKMIVDGKIYDRGFPPRT